MTGQVVILGAKGRFGRAALQSFKNKGWRVTAQARHWNEKTPEGVETVACDAMNQAELIAACQGADVIVNALNPQYHDWVRVLPRLTENVIAAGKTSGAVVMMPGNVYNFGPLEPGGKMPALLQEELPKKPRANKGALRVAMEQSYQRATQDGLRVIILRGGDFIESTQTGNWFDTYMSTELKDGYFTYPGPLDQPHAWAYLPDMGRAMEALAAKRAMLPAFFTCGFPGYTLTGAEMTRILEDVVGRPLKHRKFAWFGLRLVAPFSPLMREVLEMRYLWEEAHAIDGAGFKKILPNFVETPVREALAEAVRHHLPNRAAKRASSSLARQG